MDSNDFSLIDIGHEDDSLLRNLPPDDAGRFACSPLVVAVSAGSSRPPKTTVLKCKAHFGEIDGTLPDNNKENLNESGNMKPGSSNLSMEPQKMKRNRKAGGYNLRKSLAWDKAFFTEEGVLSSSELSMICGTPIKLDGKHLPAISEEQKTPMHANTTPTNLQTIESKSFRKLHFSSTKDKKTIEGSILKQKSLASGSLKAKKLASAASAKNSERKEGSSSRNRTPTSTNKRLLSTSPAKPLSHISKIPRVPVFKPDAHSTASSSDTSHVKRNRTAPPVPSAQKQLGQKGCSNTRSISNGAKIVSQRIAKPSKSSDQRTRKSRTVSCSREQSSTGDKVSNVRAITSSEDNSGKMLPVGLEPCKATVLIHANTGNSCSIGKSIQHQVAKPSGLRMPSPSLRFFSEPKVSNPISVGQRNVGLGETCNAIQSKIQKATMGRIPAPGPAQPCSVSHNVGSTFGVIQSKTPLGRVQPSSVSSINIPKIHDELVNVKKDDLIVRVQDLLDEKPLEQVNNKCLEEVGKYVMEHEHNILSSEGVDGKDNRSVSPIRECSEDKLVNLLIDNKSGCQAKQGQNNLPATQCRTDGYNEVQELQYPSHVTDDISQVQDGLSSNIKDLLRTSSSPERTFETDAIDSNVPEIEVYEPLLVRETLSASLKNIVDPTNKQQDKVNEPFPLEVALSASLDTEPHVEESVDLSGAEYIDETDLTGQNADLEFHESPRACKSTSQVDAVVCNVELSLSQAQGLGSMDAKSDETSAASLKSKEADLVICHHTELIDDNSILVNANQNDKQSANTNNSAGCSPHSSVDLSFPLKASKECNNGVDEVETDYQMNQEPPNPYLKGQQAENDNMSDQANCDILVRNESMDEQVESANHHEDIHNIDSKDEKTSSRILKDGKIQSQLLIRPPENVAPFSDEWLAAVEAAGEDILTLKTGPVQNSPPSKLSPEPSPWSPVKRKNNQVIGPYDCTKYSTGQH